MKFARIFASTTLLVTGCSHEMPYSYRPDPSNESTLAEQAATMYETNCAGCHGIDGGGSSARPLDDPRWWATVTDAQVVHVVSSGCGVLMPAFSKSNGGSLDDATIPPMVSQWRARWSKPNTTPAPSGWLVQQGDPTRGAALYTTACQRCHPTGAAGGITDENYLALQSDQALWNGIVFGRPDLGKVGLDISATDSADIVAWLGSKRPAWTKKDPSP
ncbi:MAG: c-type cytochrome [Planctomycetota bacterium]|nr:c-type cytochrome [Planctomycetota bacterium]